MARFRRIVDVLLVIISSACALRPLVSCQHWPSRLMMKDVPDVTDVTDFRDLASDFSIRSVSSVDRG